MSLGVAELGKPESCVWSGSGALPCKEGVIGTMTIAVDEGWCVQVSARFTLDDLCEAEHAFGDDGGAEDVFAAA